MEQKTLVLAAKPKENMIATIRIIGLDAPELGYQFSRVLNAILLLLLVLLFLYLVRFIIKRGRKRRVLSPLKAAQALATLSAFLDSGIISSDTFEDQKKYILSTSYSPDEREYNKQTDVPTPRGTDRGQTANKSIRPAVQHRVVQRQCNICGASVKNDMQFCPGCGSRVENTLQQSRAKTTHDLPSV